MEPWIIILWFSIGLIHALIFYVIAYKPLDKFMWRFLAIIFLSGTAGAIIMISWLGFAAFIGTPLDFLLGGRFYQLKQWLKSRSLP